MKKFNSYGRWDLVLVQISSKSIWISFTWYVTIFQSLVGMRCKLFELSSWNKCLTHSRPPAFAKPKAVYNFIAKCSNCIKILKKSIFFFCGVAPLTRNNSKTIRNIWNWKKVRQKSNKIKSDWKLESWYL